MPPKVDDLIERFNALTVHVLNPARYKPEFDAAETRVRHGPTPSSDYLVDVMGVDYHHMTDALSLIYTHFSAVAASVHVENKGQFLQPLKEAALTRFDEAAAICLELRDKKVGTARFHESYFRYGADRDALRRELDAKIDVVFATADSASERDRRVQRRALRTSLVVSACGVVLSALVGFGMARRNETVSAAVKRDDLRFTKREELRRVITPKLDSLVKRSGALRQVYSNYPSLTAESLFKAGVPLRQTVTSLDSAKDLTANDIAFAFGDSIRGAYDDVMTTAHNLLSLSLIDSPQFKLSEKRQWRVVARADSLSDQGFKVSVTMKLYDR